MATPLTRRQACLPVGKAWTLPAFRKYITEGFGLAFSMGLVSLVIALVVGNIPKALDPVIGNRIPGADTSALINDATAAVKDIDVHLEDALSFDLAAQKSVAALKETTNSSTPHSNPLLIQKESQDIPIQATNEGNAAAIDNALNQISQ